MTIVSTLSKDEDFLVEVVSKLSIKSTISSLTEDLLQEIFIRSSSIKSIIRCKCVCKLWLKLLTNPSFAKMHFNRNHSSSDRYPDLITFTKLNGNIEFQLIESVTFDQALTMTPNNLPGEIYPHIFSSCNGLICLAEYMKTHVDVWNPAINEYVRIPFDPLATWVSPIGTKSKFLMGFGYNLVNDEYKMVWIRMTFHNDNPVEFLKCEAMVYTMGTDSSWRVIEVNNDHLRPLNARNCMTGLYFNGVLYWSTTRTMGVSKIICFDVGHEEFSEVSAPRFDNQRDYCHDLHLVVLNGCLSLFCQFRFRLDIWSMKEHGVGDSWTRLFSIRQHSLFELKPLTFRKNGDLILRKTNENVLVCYDPANQSTKIPCIHDQCQSHYICGKPYFCALE